MENPDNLGIKNHSIVEKSVDQQIPEFTFRAVLMGIILGILVMTQNVYMGLKTGITEAGSILSAILCFAFFRSFKMNLSILENNIAQTVSTAAGSIGIIVSVIPALHLIGYPLSGFQIFTFILLLGLLGIFFTIPLRKQMLILDKLTFPTGTACATTIKTMHVHAGEALGQAKALGITGLISAGITWFRDAIPTIIPSLTAIPLSISKFSFESLSLGIYTSPMILSVGLLVGIRIGISLLIGAILSWGIIGPILVDRQIIENIGHSEITHWTMWPAISLMVASGFTSLAIRSKIIIQSLKSMMSISTSRKELIDFPFRIWIVGIGTITFALVILLQIIFQIPFWIGFFAILFSFLLAMVAIRSYGETDINPVGTMGHANQIATGLISHGTSVTNLAAGGITAGCSDVSASVMQVFKTGYLLGANPLKQIYSQFIGILIGAVVSVFVFLTVTNTYGIGTENNPAPAAIPWSGMATFLSEGLDILPPYCLTAILFGSLLGITMTLLEKTPIKHVIPSPLGIGIGMVIPGFISLTLFIGSLVGKLIEKINKKWSEKYITSIASGGIAGEAIIGVLISILIAVSVL